MSSLPPKQRNAIESLTMKFHFPFDQRFVDIYYYLWALFLMYYIEVGRGWAVTPRQR